MIKHSEEQLDIFDFVKYGHGNAVVSAVAGSGKTTTIVEALNYIKSDKRVLFLAFNNSIVDELKKRITRNKTDIKTLHSLGYSIIKFNFKDVEINVDENKYKNKLNEILIEKGMEKLPNKSYVKNILKLLDLGRLNFCNSKKELLNIANRHSIVTSFKIDDEFNEINVVNELIIWCKNSLNEQNIIDYVDMIYLPNILNLKTFKYDFVIIDEAQDLSTSQMMLFMKCFKQGTRFISVGDEKQTINGFAGSSVEIFNKLKNSKNTIELPLSTCYRCPKNIIKLVQHIVPNIQYYENAIDGEIIYNSSYLDLKDNDMVICRITLPLVKLYMKLIKENITAYIKGTDIGINLLELIDKIDDEDISKFKIKLDDILTNYVANNVSHDSLITDVIDSQEYNDLIDKIDCIKYMCEQNVETKTDLVNKITSIFSDETKKGVCLSTIHKAKGLEADNVYILEKELMPSKFCKQDWEKQQEQNLIYVAYTRAKNKLCFLNLKNC